MTKEQTNSWIEEFEVTFNLLKLDNSQEFNLNKWAKEKMFEFISKTISQETKKLQERIEQLEDEIYYANKG